MAEQFTSQQPTLNKASRVPSESLAHLHDSTTFWRTRNFPAVLQVLLRPPIVLLAFVTLVISRDIVRGEFFFYTDEMRHAMNGVFFRDFLVDFPVRHPIQYAYDYYAKYPALSFPHWPPLFHMIEGLFFLLLGLSPWVSRLTILGFALLASYFWYRISERFGPRHRAFMAALVLACMPFVLLYERVTMLEIPVLAACLATIHFWLKFLDSERRRDLAVLALASVISFLISQKAIFLVFFVLFDLVVERRFRLLRRLDVWVTLLISSAVLLPWYLIASHTLSSWTDRLLGHQFHAMTSLTNYTFYLSKLYDQMGPLLISLAGVGLIVACVKPTRWNRFLLVWVFAGYTCFLFIHEKDPRHTMLWVPPLVYLGFTGLETLVVRRNWGLIASSAISIVFFVNALRIDRPIVSGAREAAEFVCSMPDSDIVYYQGALDGDFIFFARTYDPEKRRLIARGKQVVVGELGATPRILLRSPNEILRFFQDWGIRYALIEDKDPLPELGDVRQVLNSDQFERVRTFPVHSNLPNYPVHQIEVFRYRGELHRTNQIVRIPMMTIRNDIPVNLTRLVGRPWPN
jgi:hypothetical protein